MCYIKTRWPSRLLIKEKQNHPPTTLRVGLRHIPTIKSKYVKNLKYNRWSNQRFFTKWVKMNKLKYSTLKQPDIFWLFQPKKMKTRNE